MTIKHRLAGLLVVGMMALGAAAPVVAKPRDVALARSAQAFLTHVLSPDVDRGTGAPDLSYDAGFRKLVKDNETLFVEEDLMNSDPACQCQDVGGKYAFIGRLVSPVRYDAVVHSEIPGHATGTWTVVLHRTRGRWAIYDVITHDGSFRARLIRHNACARVKRAHHENPENCPSD